MPESNTISTCEITLSGSPSGSTYTLYLQNNPRRYTQGTITTDNFIIAVPTHLFGPATLCLSTPRSDRLVLATNLKINFDLQSDTVISFADIQNPSVTKIISPKS